MTKNINWSDVLLDKSKALQLLLDASIKKTEIDFGFLNKLKETLVLFEINNSTDDSDSLKKVQELTKNIDNIKLSIESLKPKEAELINEIKRLEQSKDKNTKKVEGLSEKVQKLNNENSQLISKSEKLEQEISKIQSNIENIKAIENKLDKLKEEHDQRAQHKGSYKQEIIRLEEIKNALSDEENKLEKKTVELLDLNAKSQQANKDKEAENKILEGSYNAILDRNRSLESSVEKIQKDINSEQSKLAEYKQQEQQLLAILANIQSEIEDFQSNQDKKNQQLVRKEQLINKVNQFFTSPNPKLVDTLIDEINDLNLNHEDEFKLILQVINDYKSRLEFQKEVASNITALEKKAKKMGFDISAKQETQQEVDRDELTRLKQLVEEVRDGISDLKGSYKKSQLDDLFRS